MPTTDELIASYVAEIEASKRRIEVAEAELEESSVIARRHTLEQIIIDNQAGIKNIQADLKFYGYKAKPPVKAAERATPAREKR